MSLCKLTVRFEEPFWIGLVETEDGGSYSVAKHVFGAEPTTPEVFDFIRDHWNDLRFTHEVQVEAKESKRINPKRLRRMIEKEMRSDAWRGTKAQQTLAEQRTMAIDPTVSGVLCASSPSVAPAHPSMTRRRAPEGWVSKYPSCTFIR